LIKKTSRSVHAQDLAENVNEVDPLGTFCAVHKCIKCVAKFLDFVRKKEFEHHFSKQADKNIINKEVSTYLNGVSVLGVTRSNLSTKRHD